MCGGGGWGTVVGLNRIPLDSEDANVKNSCKRNLKKLLGARWFHTLYRFANWTEIRLTSCT